MNFDKGNHYLELHIDFDRIPENKYSWKNQCICGVVNEFTIYKHECSLIKGKIFTCENCESEIVVFGNHFEITANEKP